MQADLVMYAIQFLAAILYAVVLELVFRRRYEPDYTWVTVVWGNAQVGAIIAARLLLAPPPELAHAWLELTHEERERILRIALASDRDSLRTALASLRRLLTALDEGHL